MSPNHGEKHIEVQCSRNSLRRIVVHRNSDEPSRYRKLHKYVAIEFAAELARLFLTSKSAAELAKNPVGITVRRTNLMIRS